MGELHSFHSVDVIRDKRTSIKLEIDVAFAFHVTIIFIGTKLSFLASICETAL